MTWDSVSAAVGVAVTSIAGVVWGVRQEGRINEHDRLFKERKEQADERHADIKDRLERIENKLDRLNGSQPHV